MSIFNNTQIVATHIFTMIITMFSKTGISGSSIHLLPHLFNKYLFITYWAQGIFLCIRDTKRKFLLSGSLYSSEWWYKLSRVKYKNIISEQYLSGRKIKPSKVLDGLVWSLERFALDRVARKAFLRW